MFKTHTDHYHNNSSMSNVLNNFEETIGPDTVINWYTKEILHLSVGEQCFPHM